MMEPFSKKYHQEFQGTYIGGTKEPYLWLFGGMGFPLIIAALHTAYIGEDSSISGTEDPGMQGSRCHEAMKPKDPFV